MELHELEWLVSAEGRAAVEACLDRDPVAIALDKRLPHAPTVATQVKYLQRAKKKLPSFYEARCIIPPRAYEQASSEVLALHKELSGHTVLDLTCGLGVDTWALSQRFDHVVSVERDPVLAAVARENFRRLGITNVTVVNADAEDYLASLSNPSDVASVERSALRPGMATSWPPKAAKTKNTAPPVKQVLNHVVGDHMVQNEIKSPPPGRGQGVGVNKFDWIYVDPDRRDAAGKKKVRIEDCSPNVMAVPVAPDGSTHKLCIKLSPLFDVDEAFRIFPNAHVEVVSLNNECKEVLIYVSPEFDHPTLTATAIGIGSFSSGMQPAEDQNLGFGLPQGDGGRPSSFAAKINSYKYLFIPDVATQKARLVFAHLDGKVDIWDNNGYGFADEPVEGLLGRWIEIERIEPYNPRTLKNLRATVFKANFPASIHRPVRAGGTQRIAITAVQGKYWTIFLK